MTRRRLVVSEGHTKESSFPIDDKFVPSNKRNTAPHRTKTRTTIKISLCIVIISYLWYIENVALHNLQDYSYNDMSDSIILVHYHKTGNSYSNQLLDVMTAHENDIRRIKIVKFSNLLHHLYAKRTHDLSSGCPDIDVPRHTLFKITAPNLFCNTTNYFKSATRVVHFVRDPIDMALSSYLYHSQDTMMEKWVLSHDPCKVDYDLVNYTLPLIGVNLTEIDAVTEMCKKYFYNGNIIRPNSRIPRQFSYRHILRWLPRYDGLRLATAQFLLSDGKNNGGDLLRLPNNMIQLKEWSEKGDGRRSVLTIHMDELVKSKNDTTQGILDFMLNDTIDDETDALQLKNSIINDMEKLYLSIRLKEDDRHKRRKRTKSNTVARHVTQALLDAKEREKLKDMLSQDPILGNMLLKIRNVVNGSM